MTKIFYNTITTWGNLENNIHYLWLEISYRVVMETAAKKLRITSFSRHNKKLFLSSLIFKGLELQV